MAATPSNFVWYELMTSDAAAAQAFYGRVVGWTFKDAGVPGMPYAVASAGTAGVGGVMTMPEQARAMGARNGWLGYIHVDDVDAQAARVKASGGAIHRPPDDIPSVGRFAVVADPQGASFMLFKPSGEGQMGATDAPGQIGWRELHAADGESALAFYVAQFGWTNPENMDMGPMGLYRIFAIGGARAGGVMTSPAAKPTPFWLFYINVDSLDAAIERTKAAGGQIVHDPQQVPTGSWIAQGQDPQGAMFALLAPKR